MVCDVLPLIPLNLVGAAPDMARPFWYSFAWLPLAAAASDTRRVTTDSDTRFVWVGIHAQVRDLGADIIQRVVIGSLTRQSTGYTYQTVPLPIGGGMGGFGFAPHVFDVPVVLDPGESMLCSVRNVSATLALRVIVSLVGAKVPA